MNGQTMRFFNWAENQPDLKNHVTIGRNSYNHKVFYRDGYFLNFRVRFSYTVECKVQDKPFW